MIGKDFYLLKRNAPIHIPKDDSPIIRRRSQLLIIRKELEGTHLLGMQFLVHQQLLDLFADVPKPDLAVTASPKDLCAIVARRQCSQFSSILVCFIDRVSKFT